MKAWEISRQMSSLVSALHTLSPHCLEDLHTGAGEKKSEELSSVSSLLCPTRRRRVEVRGGWEWLSQSTLLGSGIGWFLHNYEEHEVLSHSYAPKFRTSPFGDISEQPDNTVSALSLEWNWF